MQSLRATVSKADLNISQDPIWEAFSGKQVHWWNICVHDYQYHLHQQVVEVLNSCTSLVNIRLKKSWNIRLKNSWHFLSYEVMGISAYKFLKKRLYSTPLKTASMGHDFNVNDGKICFVLIWQDICFLRITCLSIPIESIFPEIIRYIFCFAHKYKFAYDRNLATS